MLRRVSVRPEAVGALAAGEVDVSALVSKTVALRDGLAALEAAGNPENLKVILDVAGSAGRST